MRRNNEHDPRSRHLLHRALGLGLSGAALAGLIYLEGTPARAEADMVDMVDASLELDAAELVPETRPIASPAPADERMAIATDLDAAAAMMEVMPVGPPAPALVPVPNIAGMGLHKAKKELAAVGLKLAVRDEYGDKIAREDWSIYKVGTQRVAAGVEVEPGSTVKVKAAYRRNTAMGY